MSRWSSSGKGANIMGVDEQSCGGIRLGATRGIDEYLNANF